jgi:glycogen phosphorylase
MIVSGDRESNAVRVELYVDGINGQTPGPTGNEARSTTRECAQRLRLQRHGAATRPALEYTARVIPHHDGVAVPSEAAQILWQL